MWVFSEQPTQVRNLHNSQWSWEAAGSLCMQCVSCTSTISIKTGRHPLKLNTNLPSTLTPKFKLKLCGILVPRSFLEILIKFFNWIVCLCKLPDFNVSPRVKLSGINDTAESSSAVSMIPQSQAKQYQWYRRIKLSSINDTAESSSTLSMIPQSQARRYQWYRRVKLSSTNDTAKSRSVVIMILWWQYTELQIRGAKKVRPKLL